ncbi:MAG: peptidyl-prolyl cis-trans isomerase [Acidobacteria bacterium]|nr:peptidyl-prolyl cis-trans isomerase [Acidobacteriota bacterium]
MKSLCLRGASAAVLFSSMLIGQAPAQAPKPAAPKPLLEQASDPVVINIGPIKVTKSEYESFINALPPQIQTEAKGPNKRKVAEQYAELRMMAEEARKRKIDQSPAAKTQIAFQLDQMLAQMLFRDLQATAKVDDAAVQKYYEAHKGEYEEVKARHILVRFKDSRVPLREGQKELSDAEALAKAQEIKKKLDGGADFVTTAKADSDDAGSGAQGGDLGQFGRGQMVPEFDAAAFSQPVGKVGDPVRSAFGYHVIKVDERKSKSLADVKDQIEKQLRPELAKAEVESIKKANVIGVDDAYFGK